MSNNKTVTTIKQAIDSFLLSCKIEGKSYGTIECYSDKLKGFLWYATNHDWPDDITAITTQHLREFLAYLRETLLGPFFHVPYQVNVIRLHILDLYDLAR
jgi:site-specific recombinase XerD